jgi:amylosucrase
VSSYRETNPALGTIDELRQIAQELRGAGISLVLDFIFNHTSDEHDWAMKARAGDERFRRYYRVFPDRTLPDQYERTLREIFPDQAPGSFTWNDDLQGWVWTTFYTFQWDLNYENPEVLTAMMGEMLFLANVGVEVLRLDAVAFVWKRMGTGSENLPEAHMIIRALNALVQIAAPGMLFKSEAIVHPDDVASYIDFNECPISYNPTLMAMIWDALATRRVDVMTYAMQHRYPLPLDCVWVNYVRVHDDIGWSMADQDMAFFGISGYDHRQFLNKFYTGRFEGSFARGLGFGYNPKNQDLRIAGTAASLAGLEQALERDNPLYIEHALARLLMIHSLILAAGGIPLLYIGDEIATLNDYNYGDDPRKGADTRWVHRPVFDWERAELRHNVNTAQGKMFTGLSKMIAARKQTPTFNGIETHFFHTGSVHVFGFVRSGAVLCLFNFSEHPQQISRQALLSEWDVPAKVTNIAKGTQVTIGETLELAPYDYLWLVG